MASGHLKTPHQQAEHMAAPTSPCDIVQKTLANSEPSTHVDVQLRLASGEKVKKGKGYANSWTVDGADYGVEKILVPRAGNRRLYAKSALVVDMKQKNPPTKELKELRSLAADGELSNRIYAALRKPK